MKSHFQQLNIGKTE